MLPRRLFIRPCALFLLTTLALISLSWLPAPWSTWRPATCMPDACFCEAIGAGFIRQPIDTWSNLAFVLVGVLVLEDVLRPSSIRSNLLARRRVYGIVYALAAMLIGLGSWFYHASLTFVGQWFDVMGMYLFGTFMVLYNVARLLISLQMTHPYASRKGIGMPFPQMRDHTFVVGYVLFNLALGLSLIVVPELRRYLFGILLVVTIVLEGIIRSRSRGFSRELRGYTDRLKPQLQTGYFVAALLVYILAQIIWTLDLNHIVCDPTGVLQGHAIWHVLTASSAGLLYLYYRSENDPRIDTNRRE